MSYSLLGGVWRGNTGEKRLGQVRSEVLFLRLGPLSGAHGQQDFHRAKGTTTAAGATNESWEWLKMTGLPIFRPRLGHSPGSVFWIKVLVGRLSKTCIWQGLSPGEG